MSVNRTTTDFYSIKTGPTGALYYAWFGGNTTAFANGTSGPIIDGTNYSLIINQDTTLAFQYNSPGDLTGYYIDSACTVPAGLISNMYYTITQLSGSISGFIPGS